MGMYAGSRGLRRALTAERAAFGHKLADVPEWVARPGGGAP